MSKFKLIQFGYTTFGEGETIDAAREDARQWLDSREDADKAREFNSAAAVYANCNSGDLVIVPEEAAAELGDY